VEIVARASIIFFVLLVLTRGMRRRSLADMAPFEMLLLVTLGDIVQQGITQEDYSVTGAVLAVTTFAFWVSALTWLSWRSDRARRVIEGVPIVLVQDGQTVDKALALEQMPIDEILEAARQQGIEELDEVKLAVLEANGKISFIKAET
jgi:uncharacterized membrane protein YcaP (DUF421 family)